MSPYRQAPQQPSPKPCDTSDHGRGLGLTVMLGSAQMTLMFWTSGLHFVALAFAVGVVVGARMAWRGRSQGAYARLARLTRRRGQWFVATLLATGLVAPRSSQRRLARYRAINCAKVIEAGIPDPLPNLGRFPLSEKLIEKLTS